MTTTNQLTTVVITTLLLLSLLTFSGSAVAQVSDEGDRINLNSDNTLRVLNPQVSNSAVSVGNAIEIQFDLENTGTSTESGTLTISDSQGALSPRQETIDYEIEPGDRETYSIRVDATSQPTEGNIAPTNVPNTVIEINGNSFAEVRVQPAGAGVGGGDVITTGERQEVSKAFNRFNDEQTGLIFDPNSAEGIPPLSTVDGNVENTASGRVFNFSAMTDSNDQVTDIRSGDRGTLSTPNPDPSLVNVGLSMSNIPTSEYHTLQFNYNFPDAGFDQAEVRIVDSGGNEIDPESKYYLSDTESGFETRYFQLSEKESEYVNNTTNIYVVVRHDNVSSTGDELQIRYGQAISSDTPLGISQSDLESQGMKTTSFEDWESIDPSTDLISSLSSTNSFETGDLITVVGQVENKGNGYAREQVNLLEDGTVIDSKQIIVNPGEQQLVRFVVSKDNQAQHTYELSGFNDSDTVNVDGPEEELQPPVYSLESNNYVNGKLIVDPVPTEECYESAFGWRFCWNVPNTVDLDASDSFAPSGEVVEISWDLGWTSDRTGSQIEPEISQRGTYDVTLTVEDNNGQTVSVTETLYAGTLSPEANLGSSVTTSIGDSVSFDASGSTHPDPNRTITSYQWDFGDGNTATGETVNHAYSETGEFTVELTVQDDLGNTDTATKTVTVQGPQVTASVDATPQGDILNEPVTLDASDSFSESPGEIVEYEWEFDDGSTEITSSPTIQHTYDPGIYSPKVTVVNDYGESAQAAVQIEVIEDPFNVQITGPSNGDTNESLEFSALDTENLGAVSQFNWEMGDGTTYSDQDVVTHNFDITEDPQTFNVTLTGESSEYDYTDSVTKEVTIGAVAPEADLQVRATSLNYSTFQEFDASGSTDPNGSELTYTIEPSVEESSDSFNQQQVTDYIYPVDGTQTARLTVENEFGQSDTDTVEVDVNNRGPIANPLESDSEIQSDQQFDIWVSDTLNFDGSNSTHNEEPYLEAQSQWDFGDGTVVDQDVTDYRWDEPGTYEATYTASDRFGATDTVPFTVVVDSRQPVAQFSVSDQNPSANEPVSITNSSYHNEPVGNLTYSWDFGNGETSTAENPNDVDYSQPGGYTITLTVEDQFGQTDTDTVDVVAGNDGPIADISVDGQNIVNGDTVTVTEGDSVSLDSTNSRHANDPYINIQSEEWDLGDGTTQTGNSFTHTWNSSTQYNASYTITDEYGQSQTIGFTVDVEPDTRVIGETGRERVYADDGFYQTVNLNNSYDNPVVIAKVMDADGGQPAHARVANVSSNSFGIQIEEWDYLDGPHADSQVGYVVMESGEWEFSDGTKIEAGNVWTDQNFQDVSFSQNFSQTPIVFAQSNTKNDTTPVVTRNRYVGTYGFDTRLHHSEAKDGQIHYWEKSSYIAVSNGTGDSDNGVPFEAGKTGNTVTDNYEYINFQRNYSSNRTAVIDAQTEDGGDTAIPRYDDFYSGSIDVWIEEEESDDSEQGHTTEEVGYWVFDQQTTLRGTGVQTTPPARPPTKQQNVTLLNDDFESSGERNDWSTYSSAGFGTQTSNSGSYSGYTRYSGGSRLESETLNAGGTNNLELSYWVRKGDDSFSELPDGGEDIRVQYLNDNNNWQTVKFIDDDDYNGGEKFTQTVSLPNDAQHNGLRVRFYQTDGSGSPFDYWHFDDVKVTGTR